MPAFAHAVKDRHAAHPALAIAHQAITKNVTVKQQTILVDRVVGPRLGFSSSDKLCHRQSPPAHYHVTFSMDNGTTPFIKRIYRLISTAALRDSVAQHWRAADLSMLRNRRRRQAHILLIERKDESAP